MAMYIYISFGADRMEEELNSASQADTPEQIRRINAAIEAGNRIWESWALESGGEVLEIRGFEGRLRMPADCLDNLADMRRRYGQALDSGVSVGVGMKPWEADLALKAAALSGGDRLRLYGPDVQVFLEEQEEREESEDFLGKADPPLNSPAAGGGMTGPQGPQTAAGPVAPAAEASEHSENESLRSLINNQPPQAEATAAGADLHEQLGSLAGQQQQQDQQQDQAGARADEKGEGLKDLRNQVLGALQVFQAKKDELQAVAQQDPELHQALLAAIQGMISMARVVFDGQQEQQPQEVQKAEHGLGPLIDAVKQKQALKQKRIAELVDTSSGSSWKTKTGFVVVGLDPHNRNQWRATPISASGEPSSHIVAADHATALSTAADMGADLLGEPHRVMKKHESHQDFVELVKGDVLQFKPLAPTGKKFRSKAQVTAIPTDANTVWEAPGKPEHGKPIDPVANRRAAAGVVPEFEEPRIAVRGVGNSKNIYDYSHHLDPLAQKNGATLVIRHAPGKFDDGMLAELRNNLGQVVNTTYAYPSTLLNRAPGQDSGQVAMQRALTNHQNWVKFGVQKSEKVETSETEGPSPEGILHKDLMPGGKGDNKPDEDFDAEQLKFGTQVEMEEHGLDEARAKEVAKDHLSEKADYYQKDMEKAALKPGKTGRHDLMLPVGSQKDPGASGTHEAGKVKIRHADGKTAWVSVRAGQVLSADGHPTSSRNPGGK